MAEKQVSTVVRLGRVAYYLQAYDRPVELDADVLLGRTAEPCTLLSLGDQPLSAADFQNTFAEYARVDDVWSPAFLATVIIQTTNAAFQLEASVEAALKNQGVQNVHVQHVKKGVDSIPPPGPYFLHGGALHKAFRLYPDTAGAFVVASVPADDNYTYKALDAAAYGEEYPSALTVAVPSRLYSTRTPEKPYAGLRLAIKDIIDLKGLKTTGSSRAYAAVHPPRTSSSETVQRLLELGFVVVGKTKTTQFADSEWPTCDWVDYHAPFNPRGDGYLTTSGSSAGSAAAIAAYDWLDLTLGTDTLGSIRAPAAAQGIFGMRSSLGAASFGGVIPYSPKFDTIGGFARTAAEFQVLATALYHKPSDAQKPKKLLYPTDYWPVKDAASQKVFDDYIGRLETFLGIERSPVDLARLWLETNAEGITTPWEEYFANVFDWAANPDQWAGFLKGFLESYEAAQGKPPVLNPQVRFKKDYLPTVSLDQQAEAVRRFEVYKQWFYKHVIPLDDAGRSDTVIVLPWTTGEPDYRDTYRTGPQQFTGVGFFFYNVGPYAEAPEIIVPVGSTPYTSKYTDKTEQLPAALGIVGPKGSDVWLAELVSALEASGTLVTNA